MREHTAPFGNVRQPASYDCVRAHRADIVARETDAAAALWHDRRDRSQQRCFARAVCADDGAQRAFLECQRDAVQDFDLAVTRDQTVDFQQCHQTAAPR
jgi:hypothetical protein